MNEYILKLYITGQTQRSVTAIKNLKWLCDHKLSQKYNIEIIDILNNPQLAEDEKILATPLLIKEIPAPLRRIIGDLADSEKVLLGLDIRVKKN